MPVPPRVRIFNDSSIDMNKQYSGSCLCGQVRFEILGKFDSFYLCPCGYCRKDTGSAHAANLFATEAKLHWLSGEDQIRRFDLPGTRHSKGFCAVCGSALPYSLNDGALLVVPAGSLDGSVSVKPDAHLFIASRADWDEDLESVRGFDGLPS